MTTMIERVARAAAKVPADASGMPLSWVLRNWQYEGPGGGTLRQADQDAAAARAAVILQAVARAAIEAMREMTEAMKDAAFDINSRRGHSIQDLWRDVIDAALKEAK